MDVGSIRQLLTSMPNIHIPPEVLLQILAHVRDNGGPNFYLDLLSCSMVSRFWFDCAWPLAVRFFNQEQPLDLDVYNIAQLNLIIDVITKSRQLGVWKTTFLTSVMAVADKQFFEQTAHGSGADITTRLVHALQPPSKSLEIHLPYKFDHKQAATMQDFLSKLSSGTTSLRVSEGLYKDRKPWFPWDPPEPSESSEPLEPLEPLEWNKILTHDLRHQLQDITIRGTYPLSFFQALSNCPNIRNVSIESTSDISNLPAVLFYWPDLQSLKILGKSREVDTIVEQLAMNTPKHLESLHFNHCKTPQLLNLIISLAPRLVHLVFPSTPSEKYDEFLDLVASLDMPCLRYLDLSNLGNSLTAENIVQHYWVEGQSNPISLLRWPKLQRINLRSCSKISPLFLELVVASCPALEGVRMGGESHENVSWWDTWEELKNPEVILRDAGWTESIRSIGYWEYTPEVTFTKPGGNAWEAEEWLEMMKFRVLESKLGQKIYVFSTICGREVDGVLVVCWHY